MNVEIGTVGFSLQCKSMILNRAMAEILTVDTFWQFQWFGLIIT
jgi:hypothetical protein